MLGLDCALGAGGMVKDASQGQLALERLRAENEELKLRNNEEDARLKRLATQVWPTL